MGKTFIYTPFMIFRPAPILIYGVIIIAAGWMVRDIQEVFFVSILLYFLLVLKIFTGMINVFIVDGTSLLFDEKSSRDNGHFNVIVNFYHKIIQGRQVFRQNNTPESDHENA